MIVTYGSDDSIVVVRVIRSAPPIFLMVAVKSLVSPGSRCPLPLPPTSFIIVSNIARYLFEPL